MKLARAYTLPEFLHWTRRKLYLLVPLALLPVLLYHLLGWHWVALPWQVAALLGTATSFIVGFKNAQTYSRTQEAQQVWAAIMASSRYWGLICRDFPLDGQATRALVHRHLAWLTVLRHGLREPRIWETVQAGSHAEYRKTHYLVPEHASTLEADLQPLLTAQELQALQAAPHKGLGLLDQARETYDRLGAAPMLADLDLLAHAPAGAR